MGALADLALFARVERTAAEPVLPLDLFRAPHRGVRPGRVLRRALMVSVSFEVPLFVQGVLGRDALDAGLARAPLSLGWPLAGAVSGRLALRFGYRATAVSGLLCGVAGVSLLLTMTAHSSVAAASAFSFLIGVGLGLSATPLLIAVQSAVTWTRRGIATASNMFVRSFGSVVGLAVMGALVNNAAGHVGGATNQALTPQTQHHLAAATVQHLQMTLLTGIHAAFLAALLAAVLGLLVLLFLPGGSARDHAVRETVPTATVDGAPRPTAPQDAPQRAK